MKIIFCMQAMLCLYLNGLAQPLPIRKEGLGIGDIMPDIVLNKIYNYPIRSVGFSDFQKELTIIDFWATWCGSCVGSFPTMHALQKKYTGQLQLLMVNASVDDDAKKLSVFFKQRKTKTGKDFTLPYLAGDSVFSRLFPHKVIPHCVWIDKDRKVVAITESGDVNETNIEKVLKGENPGLAFKNDALLFDDEKDQLIGNDSTAGEGLLYRSLIMAEKKGAGSKIIYETAGTGKIKGMRIINYSLLRLYQLSNRELFRYGIGRLIIDTSIAALFRTESGPSSGSRYCYELLTNPLSRTEALQEMAIDLERCFNVRVVAEEQQTACYILSSGKNIRQIFTSNAMPSVVLDKQSSRLHITNGKMEVLRNFIEKILKKPVLNEVEFVNNIDIDFPSSIFDYKPEQVKLFLQSQGIELQKTQRLLKFPMLKAISKK